MHSKRIWLRSGSCRRIPFPAMYGNVVGHWWPSLRYFRKVRQAWLTLCVRKLTWNYNLCDKWAMSILGFRLNRQCIPNFWFTSWHWAEHQVGSVVLAFWNLHFNGIYEELFYSEEFVGVAVLTAYPNFEFVAYSLLLNCLGIHINFRPFTQTRRSVSRILQKSAS